MIIVLSVYGRSGLELDPDDVLRRLEAQYPNLVRIPGDQLAKRAERAAEMADQFQKPGLDCPHASS